MPLLCAARPGLGTPRHAHATLRARRARAKRKSQTGRAQTVGRMAPCFCRGHIAQLWSPPRPEWRDSTPPPRPAPERAPRTRGTPHALHVVATGIAGQNRSYHSTRRFMRRGHRGPAPRSPYTAQQCNGLPRKGEGGSNAPPAAHGHAPSRGVAWRGAATRRRRGGVVTPQRARWPSVGGGAKGQGERAPRGMAQGSVRRRQSQFKSTKI